MARGQQLDHCAAVFGISSKPVELGHHQTQRVLIAGKACARFWTCWQQAGPVGDIHQFVGDFYQAFANFKSAVGYSPEQRALDSWKHFHDRVDMTMDAVPIGYFSVFREIAAMIVPMIRSGILISDKVVPDISIGRAWSTYWGENNLDPKYGTRIKYDHEYPDYYPQAKSNPQASYAYPDAALGEFRVWLRQHYIANKFPTYLLGQTKKGSIERAIANKALESFGAIALPSPKS